MKKGIFVLDTESFEKIFGDEHAEAVRRLVDIYAPLQTAQSVRDDPSVLRDAELLISGWGPPHVDEAFLAEAPVLEAIFYGAGSVRRLVSDALWTRGIVLSSAWAMNAVPVAEFTLSQILFSLKRGWLHVMQIEREGEAGWRHAPMPGAYGTRVGIISLGAIGRLVCGLLRPFDVEVLAYDPFVEEAVFEELGARRASLDEIFEQCEVVSLHTPNLPSTRGMITGAHFARMKRDATFINTARGDVIREIEMVEALRKRPDLWAVLDVLAGDDRSAGGEVYKLPNVILTPHIAGSMDGECRRMGNETVEEIKRYLAGEPLRWQVTRERFAHMA